MVIVSASVDVSYTRRNQHGMMHSFKRGLNVAITEDNLAQSCLNIFNILQGNLNSLRETNNALMFRPILGVDIIAWVIKAKLGESKYLHDVSNVSNF